MHRYIDRAAVLVLLSLASCSIHSRRSPDCLSKGYPAAAARAALPPIVAGTQTVTDREDDVFPDPEVRTWIHLDALRTLVRRYRMNTGKLPERLKDVSSEGDNLPVLRDGWGQLVVYSSARGEYEIRAAAADGRYCSQDDVLMTEQYQPPYPSAP